MKLKDQHCWSKFDRHLGPGCLGEILDCRTRKALTGQVRVHVLARIGSQFQVPSLSDVCAERSVDAFTHMPSPINTPFLMRRSFRSSRINCWTCTCMCWSLHSQTELGSTMKRIRRVLISHVYFQQLVRAKTMFCESTQTASRVSFLKSRDALRITTPVLGDHHKLQWRAQI